MMDSRALELYPIKEEDPRELMGQTFHNNQKLTNQEKIQQNQARIASRDRSGQRAQQVSIPEQIQ